MSEGDPALFEAEMNVIRLQNLIGEWVRAGVITPAHGQEHHRLSSRALNRLQAAQGMVPR